MACLLVFVRIPWVATTLASKARAFSLSFSVQPNVHTGPPKALRSDPSIRVSLMTPRGRKRGMLKPVLDVGGSFIPHVLWAS